MTTTDTPKVRVDETLARFRDIQAQFERVRDRLRKAEEQKSTVSRRTFDKVRAEYDRELDALRAKMTPLRDELESHRSTVEGGLKDANASVEGLEEDLAEVVFRHRVGEYSDAELAEKRRALEARLEDARTRISEQRRTLDLFDTMRESEAAQPQREEDDDPVAAIRESERPRASVSAPDRSTHAGGSRPTPRAEATPDEQARRPVLRARGSESPAPGHAPAEPVAAKPAARGDAKAPVGTDFENPHDWIKEMGRDSGPKRSAPAAPATPAARPRISSTPAATAVAGKTPKRNPGRTPSLVFVNGPHAGESVPLLPTTLTIGREHDNNIELKDPDVARYHARVVYERGNYVVEDLDSTTGTWVNGQRTHRSPLNHGDVLRVGSTEIAIDFEWASDPV